jgi:ribonuclease III family protein
MGTTNHAKSRKKSSPLDRLFLPAQIEPASTTDLSLRLLAHLGDAVFHLYEREREVFLSQSAKQMHTRVTERVNAEKQAEMLERLTAVLTEEEVDLVRRARNLRPSNTRRADQSAYRRATAFEALLGYLYLTDLPRLKQLLALTTAV